MAGVELGGAQLGMALEIEPAGLHEAERLRDAVGQFDVAPRLRTILDEAEHPLPHAGEIGVAALREGAQQIERRRRLPEGFDLAARIGPARVFGEGDVVDDVAAIARQLLAVALLGRRGARLGELAGDAADFHHRRGGGISQHHRHLQEHAEEVADVVRSMLGEAFRAVAALQQESLAGWRRARAASSDCAPRPRTPAAGRSQAVSRRRPAPAGPDNPGPAGSALRASYRASNARASRNSPNLAGFIHESPPPRPALRNA